MTVRPILLALVATAASAQTPDLLRLDTPDPDAIAVLAPRSSACDALTPMPTLHLGEVMADLVPEAGGVGGLAPAPMPNLCAESVAVLPLGARFRVDPLPPSASESLGRQVLREQEQELDRLLRQDYVPEPRRDLDTNRLQWVDRRIGAHTVTHVAPSGERP